jgi:hypothetical protein
MKAAARILVTATTLAALTAFSPTAAAHATPPQHDPPGVQDQRPSGMQNKRPIQDGRMWVCNSGRGAQFDCDHDAALGSQPGPAASAPAGGGQLEMVRSLALLGLLVTLTAGAYRLRRHHRPRETI